MVLVLVLVHRARPLPAWAAGSSVDSAQVLDSGSPSGASCPPTSRLRAGPVPLTVFSSHQVYFFCSASACSPSGLETCSSTCSSGPASESGGVGASSFFCL